MLKQKTLEIFIINSVDILRFVKIIRESVQKSLKDFFKNLVALHETLLLNSTYYNSIIMLKDSVFSH